MRVKKHYFNISRQAFFLRKQRKTPGLLYQARDEAAFLKTLHALLCQYVLENGEPGGAN